MFGDMGLGQERAHGMAEKDQGQSGKIRERVAENPEREVARLGREAFDESVDGLARAAHE